MRSRSPQNDWFDNVLATLFAAVAVLGMVTVVVTVFLFLPGTAGIGMPVP